MDIGIVIDFAVRKLPRKYFKRFMESRVEDHAMRWHELGLLDHLKAVYQAALSVRLVTDVSHLALCHDLHKIIQFPHAVRRVDQGMSPDDCYTNHEGRSAHHAAQYGISERDRRIIEIHHWAYRSVRAERVVEYLGRDRQLVQKWLLLCACDAVGKGWTPDQVKQRREVLPVQFGAVAKAVGLPEHDKVLGVAIGLATAGDFDRREYLKEV